MNGRRSAPISASNGKRKYVLEGIFWVPISNCSDRYSTSSVLPVSPPGKNGVKPTLIRAIVSLEQPTCNSLPIKESHHNETAKADFAYGNPYDRTSR
jgi:hypothetical protein